MENMKSRRLWDNFVLWLFVIGFLTSIPFFPDQASSGTLSSHRNQQIRWLLNAHGNLAETNHPMVANAQAVFDRVSAAADKRSNRPPKLVMIAEAGDPWAMSLSDGSVILTQRGLEICYEDVDQSTGDSRLAFVLGHEMAHLANDDYWHWTAFEAVQRHGSHEDAGREVLDLLIKTTNAGNTKQAKALRKKKELHADAYGLLYASMAGYDPMTIVDNNGKNFFREWVHQITGKIASHDDLHPAPEQRAAFLLAYMESIKPHILLFDFGVRLYQIGFYTEALDFFNAFKKKFPCREVDNNIGLVHYQRAVDALADFDSERAFQFKLSTALDIETRAASFRGTDASKAEFRREIRQATRHFEAACEKDRFYLPSRINLSSAMILSGDYYGAMKILEETAALTKDDPRVLNNRAVAMFYIGGKMGVDATEKVIETFRGLTEREPAFPDAYFNIGRLLMLNGNKAAAEKAWAMYIGKVDGGAPCARIARSAMKIRNDVNRHLPFGYPKLVPIQPGVFNDAAQKFMRGSSRYPLNNLKTTTGAIFLNNKTRVLVLEDYVKIVECRIEDQCVEMSRFVNQHQPYRFKVDRFGAEFYRYEDAIVEGRNGLLQKVVYF
jgi:tetratricopeptide (TPR) repeat protein